MNVTDDIQVYYEPGKNWQWLFKPLRGSMKRGLNAGYPTRAEAWRAAAQHLLSMLEKR